MNWVRRQRAGGTGYVTVTCHYRNDSTTAQSPVEAARTQRNLNLTPNADAHSVGTDCPQNETRGGVLGTGTEAVGNYRGTIVDKIYRMRNDIRLYIEVTER